MHSNKNSILPIYTLLSTLIILSCSFPWKSQSSIITPTLLSHLSLSWLPATGLGKNIAILWPKQTPPNKKKGVFINGFYSYWDHVIVFHISDSATHCISQLILNVLLPFTWKYVAITIHPLCRSNTARRGKWNLKESSCNKIGIRIWQ